MCCYWHFIFLFSYVLWFYFLNPILISRGEKDKPERCTCLMGVVLYLAISVLLCSDHRVIMVPPPWSFFYDSFCSSYSQLGCLRKRLLGFRESRNFIRKWSYFRDISSDFVYFRITFYTTFSYNLACFPFEISYALK